jgi:hypothetical protein
MNETLQARHFVVLPQFITRLRAQALAKSLSEHFEKVPFSSDKTVPGAPAVYDFLPFVRLLVEKIPQVEAVSEEKVLPTYSYARLYGHGQDLRLHQDRDACELSLTLNLDADQVWPIWLQTPGCRTPHWREPFEGQFCSQVFLHYVFAHGTRAHAYFDKQRAR